MNVETRMQLSLFEYENVDACYCCGKEFSPPDLINIIFSNSDFGTICKSCTYSLDVDHKHISGLFSGVVLSVMTPSGIHLGKNIKEPSK